MKKLEDLPKTNPFEAPKGYFDRLPGIIQSRIAPSEIEVKTQSAWLLSFRYSLKYALPVTVIAAVSFFYLNQKRDQSTEDLLASVDSTYLITYLDDTDLSTDDLLESVSLDGDEADAIQQSTMSEITVDDQDAEALSKEFSNDYF